MVPGFTGSTTVPLIVPLTYDLDIASTKYLRPGRRGRSAAAAVLPGRCSPVRRTGCVELVPWHEEAAFRLPVAVAGGDGRALPGRRLGAAAAPGDAGGTAGLPVGTGAADVGRHGGAAAEGGATVNAALDEVAAVADAVLFEGYLLYPYRASAQKNRLRWQFGVLTRRASPTNPTTRAPRCCSSAGPARCSPRAAAVPAPARPDRPRSRRPGGRRARGRATTGGSPGRRRAAGGRRRVSPSVSRSATSDASGPRRSESPGATSSGS